MTGDLAAVASKTEGYAARLSLLVHLISEAAVDKTIAFPGEFEVSSTVDTIEEESVHAGCGLADWFQHEAERVYEALGESSAEREKRKLLELIERRGNSITPRELQRSSREYKTADIAEGLLSQLVDDGLGTWTTLPSSSKGGRPSLLFTLSTLSTVDTTSPNVRNCEVVSARVSDFDDLDAANRLLDEAAAEAE